MSLKAQIVFGRLANQKYPHIRQAGTYDPLNEFDQSLLCPLMREDIIAFTKRTELCFVLLTCINPMQEMRSRCRQRPVLRFSCFDPAMPCHAIPKLLLAGSCDTNAFHQNQGRTIHNCRNFSYRNSAFSRPLTALLVPANSPFHEATRLAPYQRRLR